eukprot:gene19362-biopygen17029
MSPTATLVDVCPQAGRRVRDQEGSLLPETHILRGVPRSAYWLRLERDGDVTLAAHELEAEPAVELPPPADRVLPCWSMTATCSALIPGTAPATRF